MNSFCNDTGKFSVATGFIRPKTTALFFDKVWAPYEIQQTRYGRKFGMYGMPKNIQLLAKDMNDPILYKKMLQCMLIPEMYSGSKHDLREGELMLNFSNMVRGEGRNKAIDYCTKVFKRYFDLDITPIHVDRAKYEERKNKESQRLEKIYSSSEYNTDHISVDNVLEIVIDSLPMAIEEELEWEQIETFREDKEEIQKLRRFLRWINTDLLDKSTSQIQDEMGRALDDYKYALAKHGVNTTVSGITTFLSSGVTTLETINKLNELAQTGGSDFSNIALGVTVSVGLLTYFTNSYFSKKDILRQPIAYVYDVINEPDNWWKRF